MKSEPSFTKITFGVACGILLVPLLLLAGCVACATGLGVMAGLGAVTDRMVYGEPLQLRDVQVTAQTDQPGATVSGKVYNARSGARASVTLRIEWLDQDGNVVEETQHPLARARSRLGPHETRAFEVVSHSSPRIHDARVFVEG